MQQLAEANGRLTFLLALARELARIRSPQEVVCTAMVRLRERLGVAGVMLAEVDETLREAIVLRESGGAQSRIEVSSVPLERLAQLAAQSRDGRPIVVTDARADAGAARLFEDAFSTQGEGAFLCAPVLERGRLVAILSVVHAEARRWSEGEIELVRHVADILWPALDKARADRRLTMGEERLRLAQSVALIGTWDWDPETRAMYLSPECSELLGLTGEEQQVRAEWQARIDPHHLQSVTSMLEQVVTCGMGEIEYRYHHPQRGPMWIYSKAGLVEHGGHRHVVGISLDVTSRRQAEEELKQVNQRKDEFLAMLAHELRNPLAPIRNAAQLLSAHGADRPEIEWARAVIERQTGQLVRLVDDLLDVSRMLRGQITLQKSPVTLGEVIHHALETSRPAIRRRKHHLSVQVPEQPVQLEGDLTRLVQVIANLLDNAAKYTDEGGQIRLEAELEGASVVIRVRDTGLGIAPELLPHVFDVFTQADQTVDRAEGGLGIGLTLVKRLVEMHGGAVEAHSEGLGRGAEFVVRLPVIGPAAPTVSVPTARPADVAREARQSLRVLIVDDNVDAADSVAMLLDMEGHQTRTVNTARAALLAAPEFKPEVVLLDIGLPEMDGYEVARRLRAQDEARSMRLVAVTGYGQPADRERAREAGFDEHMVKPVEPAVLQEFLQSVRRT
ncbi:MAG: response regulator [Steroidobacteraceae bacterium]|nr:response regulator [Steroidobacteraceae bacterium]